MRPVCDASQRVSTRVSSTELKRFRKLPCVRVNAPILRVVRIFRKDFEPTYLSPMSLGPTGSEDLGPSAPELSPSL
jgi:hypothetical protein